MEKTVKSLLVFVLGLLIAAPAFAQVPTQTVHMQLSWQDNSPSPTNPTAEDGFIVEQCVGVGCSSFVAIGSPTAANVTSYLDTILNDPGGRTICYRVKAFKKVTTPTPGMLSSPYSNVACAVTPAVVPPPQPPAAPGPLQATPVSSSAINLQWADPDDNEIAFEVERDGRIVMEVAANSTTVTDRNLRRNRWYAYRVRGVGQPEAGDSPWSNRVKTRTR